MLDFIRDVEYLLDFLGVKQFKIEGTSGGGPYVLAAAYHFPPDRLLKSLAMCGVTHPDYDQASVNIVWKVQRMLAGYIPFYHQFMKYDFRHALWREVFDAKGDQGQIKRVHAATQESCRQGLAGYQYDFKILCQS
jgi:pimeloyl-ACP methyl ester carboxylesterase